MSRASARRRRSRSDMLAIRCQHFATLETPTCWEDSGDLVEGFWRSFDKLSPNRYLDPELQRPLKEQLARRMTVRVHPTEEYPGGWWWPFGERFIAAHFSADIEDPRYPRCTLEIRVPFAGEPPICVGITAKDGLTSSSVKLPLNALVRQASALAQEDVHPDPTRPYNPQPSRVSAGEYFKRVDKAAKAARNRAGSDELGRIAAVYNDA